MDMRHKKTLTEIAGECRVSRWTLERRFAPFFVAPPESPLHRDEDDVLVLDDTWLDGKRAVVLITRSLRWVRRWMFARSESYASWDTFVETLRKPRAVVVDGKGGLVTAVRSQVSFICTCFLFTPYFTHIL